MKRMVFALFRAGTGNFVALVLGAISMKIMAVIAGPSAVGLFSLLRSLQQTLTTLSSCNGQNAIVQEIPGKPQHLRERFVVSVFWTFTGGVILVAAVSAVFANALAAQFLSADKTHLIRWLVVPTVFGAMFLYFRSILTAYLQIGAVAWVNISVGIASILVAVPVAISYQYFDAIVLIALLTFPMAVGAAVAYIKICKTGHLTGRHLLSPHLFEWLAVKRFLRIAGPSLLVGLIGLTSTLAIRSMAARHYGLEGAGYYDAGWTISAMYLTLFLSAMQSYLLPSMSGESEEGAIHLLLVQALRLALIVSVPLISLMIVGKSVFLKVLYSSEFLPALDLIRWTLLGDYLRVFGWVFATYLLARIDMTAYLVHEALWNLVFVILGIWLLDGGLSGVGRAYFVAYAIYAGALLWRICGHHHVRVGWDVLAEWVAGAGVVAFVGFVTWNAAALEWTSAFAMAVAISFSFLVIRPNERSYLKRMLFGWMRPLS